jgi:hypothetical protein
MLWLGSLLGTLAGILLGAVLLVAWVLLKETASGLMRLASAVRGRRRGASAVPDPETLPGGAQIYSLDERRAAPGRGRRPSGPG